MNDFFRLTTKLNALSVFRNILQDNVVSSFLTLSDHIVNHSPIDKTVGAYSEFIFQLFQHNTSFSKYLLELVLNDENFYVIGKGQNCSFDSLIEQALYNDLSVLEELSALTANTVKSSIAYSGFLPEWSNSSIDFKAEYISYVDNLHLRGYGIFSKYYAFVYSNNNIIPITNPDSQKLCELPGYERERQLVIQNTLSLLNGNGASNVLLYGDAGTGKSSTIKAILNEYKHKGLRLIEIKKDQLINLPNLLEKLSCNPLKFILFIDDLSFTENDENFSALKAILEGSIASKTNNIALYATSNRKHLVKEDMSQRSGSDLHFNDTIQETLSLSARFGLTITFQAPGKDDYLDIVKYLAKSKKLELSLEELVIRAEAFAIRNGGRSPRTAKNFIQVELLKN